MPRVNIKVSFVLSYEVEEASQVPALLERIRDEADSWVADGSFGEGGYCLGDDDSGIEAIEESEASVEVVGDDS